MIHHNETRVVITAKDESRPAFDSAKRGLSDLSEAAKNIDNRFLGVAAGLGAVATAAASVVSVQSLQTAINAADGIDDLSEKTGIAVKELAALRYAGETVGTPIDALAKGFQKLAVNMSAAANGSKEPAAAFASIGVQIRDATGKLRGADAVLADIADAFSASASGPEAAAKAVELFGKSGADLIPVLNLGRQGIADLREEAERLGVVYSADLAASAAAFNDNLVKLRFNTEGFGATLAAQVLPLFVQLTGEFIDSRDGASSLAAVMGGALRTAIETVVVTGAEGAWMLRAIGREMGGIVAQFTELGEGGGIFTAEGRRRWAAVRQAMLDDAQADRERVDAFQRRVMLSTVNPADLGPQPPSLSAPAGLRAYLKPMRAAGSAGAQDAAAKEYDQLIKKLRGELVSAYAEAEAAQHGYTKAQREFLDLAASPGWAKYTAAQRAEVAALIEKRALIELAAAEEKQSFEIVKTIAQGRADARNAEAKALQERVDREIALYDQSATAAQEREAALRSEEAALTLALTANISLAEAVEHVAIARLREKQAVLTEGSEPYLAIEREIASRERLAALIAGQEARKATERSAQDAAVAWTRATEQVEQALTDALMAGGKSGAEYIEGLFRSLILRPVIQAVVQPVAGSVLGALGLPTAAGAGALGSLGALGPLGATSFGMGLSGAWGAGGGILSTANAGLSLLGSGNIGAGLGVLGGVAAPLLIGAALLSGLDDSGTYHTGAAARSTGGKATAIDAPSLGTQGILTSRDTQTTVGAIAMGGANMLNTTAAAFGKKAGYQVSTAYADDTSKDGAWGALVIEQNGQIRSDWRTNQTSRWAPREFADGQAGRDQYNAAVGQSLRAELLALDLPGWAQDALNALGDSPSLESLSEAVEDINRTQTGLAQLGASIKGFSSLTDEAVATLLDASGGIDALMAGAAAFDANYYTAAERRTRNEALLTAEFEKQGLVMPKTRQQYRQMVESSIALGDAGAKTTAFLLKNAEAFAAVSDSVDDTTTALQRSAADIAKEGDTLRRRYLALIGDTKALRALELSDLDPSNRDLQQKIWAEEDRQAAAREAARAQEEYNRALQSASDYLAGITKSITEWVDARNAVSGTPVQNMATARAAFETQMVLAAGGDRDALGSITNYADRLISAAEQSLPAQAGAKLIAQVQARLLGLPQRLTAEQFVAQAVTTGTGATTGAVQALPGQLDTLIGAKLVEGFDRIDTSLDGQISRAEFLAAFATLGSESTLQAIFDTLDVDGDGQISRLEAIRQTSNDSSAELAIVRGDLAYIADIQTYARQDLEHIANLIQISNVRLQAAADHLAVVRGATSAAAENTASAADSLLVLRTQGIEVYTDPASPLFVNDPA